MDSLFDVTPFEKPKETKSSSTTLATGQLDIFGNVVEQPIAFSLVDEPAVHEGEAASTGDSEAVAAEPTNLTDALGAPVAVVVAEPIDPEDLVALDDEVSDDDVDVTETLNDPAWEPAIDELFADEAVATDSSAVEEAPVEEAVEVPVIVEPDVDVPDLFEPAIGVPVVEDETVEAVDPGFIDPGFIDPGVVDPGVVETAVEQRVVEESDSGFVEADVEDADVDEPAVDFAQASPVNVPLEVEPTLASVPTASVVVSPSTDALWAGVAGQDSAVAQLRNSTLHPVHAYLFHGPAGSGKRAAARSFGAALLCPRGGCGICDVCLRSLAEVHPDLIVVEREGASISVDQAREIIRLALRSPTEGRRKVLVLVDFHLVSTAGPTLLKIIEEPPESTVFVILADQITNELVTIASRCSKVSFAPISRAFVVASLMADGLNQESAERVALAAGGRLDRARLLASDPQLGGRLSFWQNIPRRLDGTGATASVVAGEAMALVEGAAVGPLEEKQAVELKELEARLEGTRGGVGLRKELQERHKRELKRLRDDELRFGLTTLQQAYRERAVDPTAPNAQVRHAFRAVSTIGTSNEHLVRNPNLGLFLQALFVRLSETSADR